MNQPTLVFPDKELPDCWRVEYFDREGGCYVAFFAGPKAEERARAYHHALETGALKMEGPQ